MGLLYYKLNKTVICQALQRDQTIFTVPFLNSYAYLFWRLIRGSAKSSNDWNANLSEFSSAFFMPR